MASGINAPFLSMWEYLPKLANFQAAVCRTFGRRDRTKVLLARSQPTRILSGCFRTSKFRGQNGPYSMKIHEYQAKEILARYGVAVPRGEMANTPEEASAVARKLFSEGASGVVVKAQIHAGGRGKGGGVKVAKTREEAETHVKNILGMTLVTHQTGPAGQKVQRLLIEETAAIDRELYLGIVLDRATGKLVFMASQAGGMEIEEVAAKTPEAIFKETIDPAVGFAAYQARKLAFALGLKPTQINQAVTFFQSLYKAVIDTDASLVEINPFITTKDDKLFALDAKITFDDNALFRHPDIKALRDVAEEDPLEVEASKYALNYIKLDGSIACMVNGAGLAMATMDIIQYAGGSPANFLDVGGGRLKNKLSTPSKSCSPTPTSRPSSSTSSAASSASTAWPRASLPRQRISTSKFLSSCASKAPTSKKAGRS